MKGEGCCYLLHVLAASVLQYAPAVEVTRDTDIEWDHEPSNSIWRRVADDVPQSEYDDQHRQRNVTYDVMIPR